MVLNVMPDVKVMSWADNTLFAFYMCFFFLDDMILLPLPRSICRFSSIHISFFAFLGFWIYQILWVWVVSLPIIFVHTAKVDVPIGAADWIGWTMWVRKWTKTQTCWTERQHASNYKTVTDWHSFSPSNGLIESSLFVLQLDLYVCMSSWLVLSLRALVITKEMPSIAT